MQKTFQLRYHIDPEITEKMYGVGTAKRVLPLSLIAVHNDVDRLRQIKIEANARVRKVRGSSLGMDEQQDVLRDIAIQTYGDQEAYEDKIKAGLKYAMDQINFLDPYLTPMERRIYEADIAKAKKAFADKSYRFRSMVRVAGFS